MIIELQDLYQHCIERDETWASKAHELAKTKAHIKALQALEEKLTDELALLSEGHPSKGGGFIFDRVLRKGSVQYKDIPQLKGVNLDYFRGPDVGYWKLTMELK